MSYFCQQCPSEIVIFGMKTLEDSITARISRRRVNVLMREDFADLGGYDQVGRVLRRLVAKDRLVRIGYGLYAKATRSPLSGRTVPRKGLPVLAAEALRRLDVAMQPSQWDRAYGAGRTTQVPTGRVIGVTGRISRRIGYDGAIVSYERAPCS